MPEDAQKESPTSKGHTANDFASWCVEKHQHLLFLWRKLDKNGSMSLTKQEFLVGMRQLRYEGDLDELWLKLDADDSGMVSLFEFAPEQALELAQFKQWANDHFGSIAKAFRLLVKGHGSRVSFEDFSAACISKGLPEHLHHSMRTIFMATLDHSQVKGMAVSGFPLRCLDEWEPPPFLFASPDHMAKSRLSEVLIRRHGNNALLAFRKALDRNGSMRVSYDEFSSLCRQISRRNNFMELHDEERITSVYCSFDGQRSGWFGLNDWDEDSYVLLRAFFIWARASHSSVQQFIRDKEDTPGKGISIQDFRRSISKPLGIHMESVVTLIEGITLEKFKSGQGMRNIRPRDVAFLDNWDPEREKEDKQKWRKVTNQVQLIRRSVSSAVRECET